MEKWNRVGGFIVFLVVRILFYIRVFVFRGLRRFIYKIESLV